MLLVRVLRVLALRGVGLASTPGGLGVYPSRYPPEGPTLTPELRTAVGRCKAALIRLVDEAAIRRAWRIPGETPLGPQLSTLLAWLLAERAVFTRDEYQRWHDQRTAQVEAGVPGYVADILAADVIARERLQTMMAMPTRDREAA